MPYIIALVIIIVSGIAFTLTQTSSQEDVVTENQATNERSIEEDTENTSLATNNTSELTGTFSAQSSYLTPRREEHLIDVELTVEDGIITDAEVLYNGEAPKTPNHSSFDEAYEEAVIGQPISEVSLSRTGGSSLTSASFNEAVESILEEEA